MEIFNALNLSQITGGTKLKQGDFGSVLSYSLADENGQEITSFDTKTAYINLVLDDKILFTTTTQVDISRVTFHIDKAIPTGLYYLEIKIDDYIFPSDKDSVILIEEGATAYDLKDLIPNYDTNMTISSILSDLSKKGIDISDLNRRIGNANAELIASRNGKSNLKTRIDDLENETTAQLAEKVNKDEVANGLTAKGAVLHANLPTTGNTVGDYYYCSDGDGVHPAGNYVWNGTTWYFGGTGDNGYNKLVKELDTQKSNIDTISENYKTLLPTVEYEYIPGQRLTLSKPTLGFSLSSDSYAGYAKIPVMAGERYLLSGGLKNVNSENYPFVLFAFSDASNKLILDENYDYLAGVTANVNTKVDDYFVKIPVGAMFMYVCTVSLGSRPIIIKKHEYVKSAKKNNEIGFIEKTVQADYALTDMNFNLISSQRHFYDLNMPLWDLNPNEKLFGSNSNIYPRTDVQNIVDIAGDNDGLRFGYWGADTAESKIRLAGLKPFAVYDFDISTISGTGTNKAFVEFANGSDGSKSFRLDMDLAATSNPLIFNGTAVTYATSLSSGNFVVRIHVMGTSVAIFIIKDGLTTFCGTYSFADKVDFCYFSQINKYSIQFGAILTNNNKFILKSAKGYLSCGVGQADIRLLKTIDGVPIVKDNKFYLSMSCRGFAEGYGQSVTGIFEFEPTTQTLKMTGQLFAKSGDLIRPCVGVSLTFDSRNSNWNLLYSDRFGVTTRDVRFGTTYIEVDKFAHAFSDTALYNWIEDPDIYFDAKLNRYRMCVSIYVKNGNYSYPYAISQLESEDLMGPWVTTAGRTSESLGGTGTSYVFCGGVPFVTTGTADDKIGVYTYNTNLPTGSLSLSPTYGGFRTWGCVMPIDNGDNTTSYMLMTFDRNRGYGSFSYGNLYFYISKEVNTGIEHDRIKHTWLL